MRWQWRRQTTGLLGLLIAVLVAWYPLYRFIRYPWPTAHVRRLSAQDGFEISVFAAEPMVVHPVCLAVDEQNRLYVCETFAFRNDSIIPDNQLGSRTFEQSVATRHEYLPHPTGRPERLRRLEDRSGSGSADHVTTLIDDFDLNDGVMAGVLPRDGKVWLANVPKLWLLENGQRRPLLHGFGVRHLWTGHDLHGLIFGPDGKLYFSMGDRGLHVRTPEGKLVDVPDTGSILRCNPDGSGLEVFAIGFRNPQDLAFDQFGNLFTGDNNSNHGDPARWVHVVEGGDSGWRIGFCDRGAKCPWISERLWDPAASVPYRLPPVACLGNVPAGVAFYPGVGLPAAYDNHFLLCDFSEHVLSFAVQPKGAGFELAGDVKRFLGPMWATDVTFGMDGSIFVSDWVYGQELKEYGRIFRVRHPVASAQPIVAQTRQLLAGGMDQRSHAELANLLGHRDQRVRQAAQFALARRGAAAIPVLTQALDRDRPQLARIHAIWGLGQIAAQAPEALASLPARLEDADAEIRAQTARVLGDYRCSSAFAALLARLNDPSPRVRYFAALAVGKLGRSEAVPAVLALLRATGDQDPVLRHAGVMALAGIGDVPALVQAGRDPALAVRLGALLALRRLARPEITLFLDDREPSVVLEAARAIYDVPIPEAMPALAALASRPHLPEAAASRVINANFRLGTATAAEQLAALAASAQPPPVRIAALEALAEWGNPPGRDRLLGLWRPLPPRSSGVAAVALRAVLPRLFQDGNAEVVAAVARAAAALQVKDATGELLQLVRNVEADPALRSQALAALASLPQAPLAEAVNVALAGPPALRCEAIRQIPKARLPDAVVRLRALAGPASPLSVRQASLAALGELDDPEATSTLADVFDQALTGRLPAGLHLDLLEAAAKKPALKERIRRWEANRPPDPLAAWWETLEGGDAERGRKVFLYHPSVHCLQCHMLEGVGGVVGPPLNGIGAKQPRRYLLEALVLPNAAIAKGYEQVRLLLRDGSAPTGRVAEESDQVLLLLQPDGQRRRIAKADIEERVAAPSPMPQDLATRLSRREVRDLVEFLASLK